MIGVLKSSWALLLGMMMLMVGNGLQGTLLGVRGAVEGFSANTMAFVMSGYFLGFLLGSRMTPDLIRRVGHVRVFAALASLVSACFILFAAAPVPWVWAMLRVVVGLCFSGIYVVAESWLNESTPNETRGQALSLYLIVQMLGIIAAQLLLNVADPGGYLLFVIMSVLVSISFAPILLSASPAPVFDSTKPMSLARLFSVSPLGMVGTFVLGGIFAGLFGMGSVFSTEVGHSAGQTSIFIAMIYTGGLVCQYPIGWISDRMDRRRLIMLVTAAGALVPVVAYPFLGNFTVLCFVAFVIGGIANPLYSLLIAYTNDFLAHEDMAAASGGLIFANGVGAVSGPFIIGWLMEAFGPYAFIAYLATLMGTIAGYALWRMTRRPAPQVSETTSYTPVLPQASVVAVEWAQEYDIDQAQADADKAG